MQFIAKVSRSGMARTVGAALVLALVVGTAGLIFADNSYGPTHGLFVRVFEGDPGNDIKIANAEIKLVADDSNNPSNGMQANTDGMGNHYFPAVNTGWYTVKVGGNLTSHYSQDFRIHLEGDMQLDATLIKKDTGGGGGGGGGNGCLPTPPRGKPLLNIWPISESGADCTDYPLLAAKNVTRGQSYGHSVSASDGEIIRIRLYVHNGTLDYVDNEAFNVMVKAALPTGSTGAITAEAWGDNADRITSAQKGGNVSVSLGNNQYLEYIPGSAQVYSRGPNLIGGFSDSVVTSGASLGNMRGCYEFLRFVTFEARVKSKVVVPDKAKLTVVKKVVGGTLGVSDFPLFVSGRSVTSGQTNEFDPGIYYVSETNRANYTASFSGECGSDGRVNLAAGDNKTCIITNTFQEPPKENPRLTVIKKVVGGTLGVSDFPLFINSTQVQSGSTHTLTPGTYTVSETNRANYNASFSGDCNASGQVTLNHGDNKTCIITNTFQAPGLVTFEKTVRNISQNQTIFTKSVAANPGEVVEFKLRLEVTQGNVYDMVIKDQLPSRLLYVNNSLSIDVGTAGNDLNNIQIGTLSVNMSRTVTFRAVVAAESQFTTGTTELVNTATLTHKEGALTDTAKVVVTKNPPAQVNLSIDKKVRKEQIACIQAVGAPCPASDPNFTESVTIAPGEKVEFRIIVGAHSSGNTAAQNVILRDVLPNNFIFNFAVTDQGTINTGGSSIEIPLGTINAGSTKTVTIFATAASAANFPIGSSTWTNTATASASNANSVTDTANVVVVREGDKNTTLSISKTVANVTTGTGYLEQVSAKANDKLDFQIVITNTGSVVAKQVRLADALPGGLTYDENGLIILGATNTSGVPVRSPFLLLGDMNPGQKVTVKFFAYVTNAACNTTLVNQAFASAENAAQVSDTASVNVICNPSLTLSKKAYNDTLGRDATTTAARSNDIITYTLAVKNSGGTAQTGYVFSDDITDILQLANIIDFGGGNLNVETIGNIQRYTIIWPSTDIPANSTVEKTFKVQVKDSLPSNSDFVMTNVFGNTVNVAVRRPTVLGTFTAPPTGTATTVSLILAAVTLTGFFAVRNRELLLSKLNLIRQG
jgi:uncharacterized repeat protein (TIGR01451 family)